MRDTISVERHNSCLGKLIANDIGGQPIMNHSKWPKQQGTPSYYSTIVKRIRYSRHFIAIPVPSRAMMLIMVTTTLLIIIETLAPISVLDAAATASQSIEAASEEASKQQQQQQESHKLIKQEKPEARVGGLDPNDYIDEAGELEIMAHQQQIPTAQLMAAAGHSIPENYFLPGGSIPALYALRYQQNLLQQQQQQQFQQQQQQIQQQQQQQQQTDPMQTAASHHVQARHVAPGKFTVRQADLIAAATAVAEQQQQQQQDLPSLVDFNGYNLVSGSSAGVAAAAGGDSASNGAAQQGAAAATQVGAVDLAEFLNPSSQQALYEQQQQQHQYAMEQQLIAELAALQRQQQQQDYLAMDQQAQASENSLQDQYAGPSVGPSYQVEGLANQGSYESGQVVSQNNRPQQQQQQQQQLRPLGLPTKSSSRKPSDMLEPLGNPKTISSPVIDFVTNQLPKTSHLEKLAEKVPQSQMPTVFSFASSKDPNEKVKVVNQKKRNVMRQAEQLAKMMIKSVNEKFGTNIGDQTDLPFLLSTLTPLGVAQNLLVDPTLIVTLLNTLEKTYLSDILPGPAKAAIRPVLNIFRMPNKKRDKANLSNVISFLASGMQAPSQGQVKHRQAFGIERNTKSKNSR